MYVTVGAVRFYYAGPCREVVKGLELSALNATITLLSLGRCAKVFSQDGRIGLFVFDYFLSTRLDSSFGLVVVCCLKRHQCKLVAFIRGAHDRRLSMRRELFAMRHNSLRASSDG